MEAGRHYRSGSRARTVPDCSVGEADALSDTRAPRQVGRIPPLLGSDASRDAGSSLIPLGLLDARSTDEGCVEELRCFVNLACGDRASIGERGDQQVQPDVGSTSGATPVSRCTRASTSRCGRGGRPPVARISFATTRSS